MGTNTILAVPNDPVAFLERKFTARPQDNGTWTLRELDLCAPGYLQDWSRGGLVPFGNLLKAAAAVLRPGVSIDIIVVTPLGLQIWAGGTHLFTVGDATVIGNVARLGNDEKRAETATRIVSQITRLSNEGLEPIKTFGTILACITCVDKTWRSEFTRKAPAA